MSGSNVVNASISLDGPLAWEGDDLDPAEYALVPLYDVRVSAGAGAFVESEEVVQNLAFRRVWLKKMGLEASKLALVSACGDSMEPTFSDGDLLLVDLRKVELKDGAIHVIRNNDHLLVKRMQVGLGDAVIIVSDNSRYRPLKTRRDCLDVIGRVVWRGGQM